TAINAPGPLSHETRTAFFFAASNHPPEWPKTGFITRPPSEKPTVRHAPQPRESPRCAASWPRPAAETRSLRSILRARGLRRRLRGRHEGPQIEQNRGGRAADPPQPGPPRRLGSGGQHGGWRGHLDSDAAQV